MIYLSNISMIFFKGVLLSPFYQMYYLVKSRVSPTNHLFVHAVNGPYANAWHMDMIIITTLSNTISGSWHCRSKELTFKQHAVYCSLKGFIMIYKLKNTVFDFFHLCGNNNGIVK